MALHHAQPPDASAAITACFPDMSAARTAIEALENAGVDGDDIELLGHRAEAARVPTRPGAADRRVAGHLVRRIALGALVGAVGGAVLGAVLGLLALLITSSEGAGFVAAFVLVGVGLGVVVSVFVSFERGVGFSSAWPLTFEDDGDNQGSVWVGVYSREPGVRERAHDVLAGRHPLELRTTGRRG